jgi:LDH2 family malate/lactate/ureidoglycolate dehydrogenase
MSVLLFYKIKLHYLRQMEQKFSYHQLFAFVQSIFIQMGCSENDAITASKSLISADLRGVDSHGIARLVGYVRLWEIGRINSKPQIKIIHETPSTGVVDGDSGLGLVVAPWAMNIAIEKAKQVGSGWLSVQNSNHFGIAGHHAMMALPHDMIGIAMTNASALVSPTFSKERMLGTNPIAVAIPAGEQPPFVADFATTTAANGKLEISQRKNMAVPSGWVQDENGNETNDAHALKQGGALLPLGGDREHSSHKGFMLGSIVDIFSGVLSGANFGPWVPPFPAYVPMPENMPGKGIGHFFGAMSIDAFRTAESFKKDMDLWISRFRESNPIDDTNPVVIPGDPERLIEQERIHNGIPIPEMIQNELKELGAKFNVSFDLVK